jgi:hypothetical protein
MAAWGQQQMLTSSLVLGTVDSQGAALLLLLRQPGLLAALLLKTAGMLQQQMIWMIPWTAVIRSWRMHQAVQQQQQQQASAAGVAQPDQLQQLTLLLLLLPGLLSCWHLSPRSQAAQQATRGIIITRT